MERRESAEISKLLSIGFLVDRLLLALELHDVQRLASQEPELLSDLTEFLEAVEELAEHPSALLSRQTTDFAFPPAEYVALELVREQLGREQRHVALQGIRRLKEIVETIRAGSAPAAPLIATLRQFLERVADTSLEEVDDRRMRAEVGKTERRSLIEWQKT